MKKSNLIYYIATFLVFFLMITFDVFANCPLGPDVTKDLYNVLNVMKIVAPLLCVVLSIYDAIRAVAKGDPATDMKAVAKKFGKRMIYTIILFFIPVLVDICFQMADVWDVNGTCDLANPEDNNSCNLEYNPTGNWVVDKIEAALVCGCNNSKYTCENENIGSEHKCVWYNNSCILDDVYNSKLEEEKEENSVNCYDITNEDQCRKYNKCDWLGTALEDYNEVTGEWIYPITDYWAPDGTHRYPYLCVYDENTINGATVNCPNIKDRGTCEEVGCWWDDTIYTSDTERCHHDYY